MDETTQHFLDANPGTGGDPKTLRSPLSSKHGVHAQLHMDAHRTQHSRVCHELDGDRHGDYARIHCGRFAVEL